MTAVTMSLDTVAAEINARFRKAAEIEQKATDHRIAAGRLLIEARDRVQRGEAGSIGWEAWCTKNIKRSLGDVRKVMLIAGAKDPAAALTQEREKRTAGMREHRSHVGAVAQIDHVKEEPVNAGEVTNIDPAKGTAPSAWKLTVKGAAGMTPEERRFAASERSAAVMIYQAEELEPSHRYHLVQSVIGRFSAEQRIKLSEWLADHLDDAPTATKSWVAKGFVPPQIMKP
jgi:hypothetical protein